MSNLTIFKLVVLVLTAIIILIDIIHNAYEYIINKCSLKTFIILEVFDLFYILLWIKVFLFS